MHHSTNAALVAAFTFLVSVASAPPSALPQFKPKPSDEDLNAIGHRNISRNVNFFAIEGELALGKHLTQEVERSSKMLDDTLVDQYLIHLAQNIANNSDAKFPITVRVVDSSEWNAFTLPGGFQYVNRGLIVATESEAELAGVLAHGIARTALRESTARATKGELMQLASIPATIFTPYSIAGYSTFQGLNISIPLTSLKFSRDTVFAADFFGLQYLYKSGYDPEAYLQLLERTSQQPPQGQNVPKVFGTHPPLAERLKALRDEIDRLLPRRDSYVVPGPDYEGIKERLRAWQPKHSSAPSPSDGKPTLRKPGESNL